MNRSRSTIEKNRRLQIFFVIFVIFLMIFTAISVTPVSAYKNDHPQTLDNRDLDQDLMDELNGLGINNDNIEDILASIFEQQDADLPFSDNLPSNMLNSDLDMDKFIEEYYQSHLFEDQEWTVPEIESSEPSLELGTVVLNDTDSSITTLTTFADGSTLERTSTKAVPVIRISETTFDLDDLVVPIIHSKTGEASDQLFTTIRKQVNITYEIVYTWDETVEKIANVNGIITGYDHPSVDYHCMVLIDQYKLVHTSTYTATYKIMLPLEVVITYPETCIAGESYELEVTVNPLGSGEMSLSLRSEYNVKTYEHIITKTTKVWVRILGWIGIIGIAAAIALLEVLFEGSGELLLYLIGLIPSPPSKPLKYEDYAEGNWDMEEKERKWIHVKTFRSGVNTISKKIPHRTVTGSAEVETPLGDRPSVYSFNGTETGKMTYQTGKFIYLRGGRRKWKWTTYNCPGLTNIGLSSFTGAIFAEKVTAELAVTGLDFINERTMAWGEEHDSSDSLALVKNQLISTCINHQDMPTGLLDAINTMTAEYGANGENVNRMMFTIPENTTSSSTRFSLSNLNYYIGDFAFTPEYYVNYGNIKSLLSSAYGWSYGNTPGISGTEYYPVRAAASDLPEPLNSGYSYSTDLSVFPYINYDFDVSINPIETEHVSDTGLVHYSVELTSLGESEDFIELEVVDLPIGFTAFTDKQAYYIRPGQGNEAILTINITGNSAIGPGSVNLTLAATSQAKTTRYESNSTIAIQFEYIVPEIHDLELFPNIPYHEIFPGETSTVNFTGLNTGNVNDNFTFFAEMTGPLGSTWNWTGEYETSRYTTENQSFYGEFNFTYSPEDFFPRSDNISLFITVTSATDPEFQLTSAFILSFLPYYNVTTTLTPPVITMLADYKQEYRLIVTNTGNIIDNFTISADGWTDFLHNYSTTVRLDVGDSREFILQLSVPDPMAVPVQEYEFRVFAASEGHPSIYNGSQLYSISVATINYLDPGLVPPGLRSRYNGSTLVYPLTTLNLGPIWTPIDYDPGTYSIYVNDSVTFTGSWSSGEDITAVMKNVSGYGENLLYNVTAVFADSYGNATSDHVWVQIDPADNDPPVIIADNDLTVPENWAYPVVINWQYEEDYVFNLSVLLDGTSLDLEDLAIWNDGESPDNAWNVTYILNPGSLGVGNWNYTLDLKDMSGFNETSTIMVNVVPADNTPPAITTPPASSTTQGHGETIPFIATDAYHHHYEVLVEGVSMYNGTWYSSVPASIPSDRLSLILGDNDVELLIYDLSGNVYSHTWTLTLVDNDDPIIVASPENVILFEHNSSNILFPSWTAEDQHPALFAIYYRNGSLWELLFDGVWSPFNNTVRMHINHLSKGIHEFQVVFTDTSGNEASDIFTVTVEDIIAPAIIPLAPITYEPFRVAKWFEFIIDESNPLTYQLYRDNVLIGTGDLTPSYQVVLVDLGYLPDGEYNYTIVMTDDSGNTGIGSTIVTVFDLTPPVIDGPPLMIVSEGSTGNTLHWIINEANPVSYSLYHNGILVTSLDLTSIPAPVHVNYSIDGFALGVHEFVITVEDMNGLSRSLTTYVQVLDLSPPGISMFGDYNAEPGDPNAVLIWIGSDTHPSSYQLLVDGTTVQEGPWAGEDIELQLVGWAEGTYTVRLIVTDSSGNTAVNELTVTIAESALTSAPFESPFGDLFTILLALGAATVLASLFRRRRRR